MTSADILTSTRTVVLRGHPRFGRAEPRWCGWLAPVATLVTGGGALSAVSLLIYCRFGTSMDLTIFTQAIRGVAHGGPPVSAVKGPHANIFGDHWHPLILVLVPLFWLWDDPRVLLLAQAVCVAAAGAVLTRSATRRDVGLAFLGPALLVSPGVMAAIVFDVHEVALGAPLLALACSAFADRRWRSSALWSLLLLPVKEDAGLLVIGLCMALWCRGQRRIATLLSAASVVWMVLAVRLFIPAMNAGHTYTYAAAAPDGPAGVARTLLQSLVWPGLATCTAIILVAVTGGAALRSPLVLVAAVPWLVRAAVPNWRYWALVYHYSLLPAIALFFAALDGGALQRSRRARQRMGSAALLSSVAAVAMATPHLIGGDPASARAALARIPDGAQVAAPANLSAHLATRTTVVLASGLDPGTDAATQWIILDDEQAQPAALETDPSAWHVVHRGARYTVLHRQIPPRDGGR